MTAVMLNDLACKFFREFARYEYCLKATWLREGTQSVKASWSKYAAEVTHVIDAPQSQDLVAAISYFSDHPPKKQIVKDRALDWDETLPDHKSKAELILLLICRVRNNLFYGGSSMVDGLSHSVAMNLCGTHSLFLGPALKAMAK